MLLFFRRPGCHTQYFWKRTLVLPWGDTKQMSGPGTFVLKEGLESHLLQTGKWQSKKSSNEHLTNKKRF